LFGMRSKTAQARIVSRIDAIRIRPIKYRDYPF
ncbi:hypothetical protein AX23_12375, partial [Brucella melitensis 548]